MNTLSGRRGKAKSDQRLRAIASKFLPRGGVTMVSKPRASGATAPSYILRSAGLKLVLPTSLLIRSQGHDARQIEIAAGEGFDAGRFELRAKLSAQIAAEMSMDAIELAHQGRQGRNEDQEMATGR